MQTETEPSGRNDGLFQSTPGASYMSRPFWIGLCGIILYMIKTAPGVAAGNIVASIAIVSASLLPAYLWSQGKVSGLPLYPLFSLTFLWTHGLQFLTEPEAIAQYSEGAILMAAGTIVITLLLGMVPWLWLSHIPAIEGRTHLSFREEGSYGKLLTTLICSILFNMALNGGYVDIAPSALTVIRAGVTAINGVTLLLLGYLAGTDKITAKKRICVNVAVAISCFVSASTLFLVGAFTCAGLYALGLILGRRSIPWVALLITFFIGGFLHSGKAAMREKYWEGGQGYSATPSQYVPLFLEWISTSEKEIEEAKGEKANSLLGRSSLLQLLLLIQAQSPERIPFMEGETYTIIPSIVVPRFINPNKLPAHEGNFLLNIHYDLQTREDTVATTIGWGLLNEAYANFGFSGCWGLGLALGTFYGGIGWMTKNASLFSWRMLFGLFSLSFTLQSEFSASVFISSFLQGSSILAMVGLLFMGRNSKSPDEKETG